MTHTNLCQVVERGERLFVHWCQMPCCLKQIDRAREANREHCTYKVNSTGVPYHCVVVEHCLLYEVFEDVPFQDLRKMFGNYC